MNKQQGRQKLQALDFKEVDFAVLERIRKSFPTMKVYEPGKSPSSPKQLGMVRCNDCAHLRLHQFQKSSGGIKPMFRLAREWACWNVDGPISFVKRDGKICYRSPDRFQYRWCDGFKRPTF